MLSREVFMKRQCIDEALGRSQQYVKLNRLGINDEDIDYLTQRDCTKIEKIEFDMNSLTEKGVFKLATAKIDITYISLFKNSIDSRGCKHIAGATWNRLQKIILSYNLIGDKGLKFLSEGKWTGLRYLGLNECQVSDVGMGHLSKGQWGELEELKLNDNKLSKECFVKLAKGNWKELKKIELNWNHLTEEGIVHIFSADWAKLTECFLRYNKTVNNFKRPYKLHMAQKVPNSAIIEI